jgi:hypothetical protein
MINTMAQLTENLGYYNDLHIACVRIEEYAEEYELTRSKLGELLNGLEEEMKKAKSDSKQIYEMQYAEEPKHFIRRMNRYWDLHAKSLGEGDTAT